jgi:hypothetical protein
VVKYTSLAKRGDSFAQAIGRLSTMTIVDMENAPATIAGFGVGQWYHSPIDSGGWGFYVPNLAGLLDADLRMAAMSSGLNRQADPPEKIADILNTLVDGNVISYNVFRLGRGNPANTQPAYFTGKFTAAEEGHLYHALQLYETDRAVFGPAVIKGVRGTASAPPGEVFALGTYKSSNLTIIDVEVDGTDANGVPVASGGIGSGNTSGSTYTYTRVNVHDIIHGGGITHYLLTDMTLDFVDSTTVNNGFTGLNFEQCGGSTIYVTNHTFGGSPVDMIIDANNGFATVVITDPKFSDRRVAQKDKLIICVHDVYDYPAKPRGQQSRNTQLDPETNNHVTLIVDGASRPDLIQFVSGYKPRG